MYHIRPSVLGDLDSIRSIYNEGIEDRIATLETLPKTKEEMENWYYTRSERHPVWVAVDGQNQVVGWASLNVYNARQAYRAVADISVYIQRSARGKGLGSLLLQELECAARQLDYHKLVLFTFPWNELGQGLYRKRGFREVGIFREQGMLDGKYVDVMAMEKIL